MFTFIQTKSNTQLTKKWESFIRKCTQKFNDAGIDIDSCYLQSILIQHIYTTYLIHVNTIYYGFDYSKNPIQVSDIIFWKVCSMKWGDQSYLFHKHTQAVFQIQQELVWKGIFDFPKSTLLTPEECPSFVKEWFKKSNFVF